MDNRTTGTRAKNGDFAREAEDIGEQGPEPVDPQGAHRLRRASREVRGVGLGEWLSLVEHLVRDQGVAGSNPVSPTRGRGRSR